ncbi:MAG: nucleotidyltransferase domain-containing protein [Nitrospinota bacterium]
MKKEISEVTNILERDDTIHFSLLFGSYSIGRTTRESDIDLAIFFKMIPDFFLLENLKSDISQVTKKKIDIVVLNTAAPVICMQVLKTGRLLFRGKSKEYNSFFVRTVIAYDDLKRTRKGVEENILKGRIYAGS